VFKTLRALCSDRNNSLPKPQQLRKLTLFFGRKKEKIREICK
jgi:hypothetical protein